MCLRYHYASENSKFCIVGYIPKAQGHCFLTLEINKWLLLIPLVIALFTDNFTHFSFIMPVFSPLGLQMTLTSEVSTDILPDIFCFGLLLLFMLFPWYL